MSGNFAIKGGGGVGPLMANAILNFHFDYLTTSLSDPKATSQKKNNFWKVRLACELWTSQASYAMKHFVFEVHEHDFIGAKILKMR